MTADRSDGPTTRPEGTAGTATDRRDRLRKDAPSNEVPGLVRGPAVLHQDDDLAFALADARLYSVGMQLWLGLRSRAAEGIEGRDIATAWSMLLIGVEFADGRRAMSFDRWFRPGQTSQDEPTIARRGVVGVGRRFDELVWISPAPPPGDLVVVTACEALGVPETRHVISAEDMAAARDAIIELWPWEPEPEPEFTPPVLPTLPSGGWFEETASLLAFG